MKKNNILSKIIIPIAAILLYSIAYLYLNEINTEGKELLSYFLCWCGIVQLVYDICLWKSITKKWLSLQMLFITFCFLFNYGQCFLWAFNIHSPTEIGASLLFYKFKITPLTMCESQLITLIILSAINMGMAIKYDGRKRKNAKKQTTSGAEGEEKINNRSIAIACKYLFFLVAPISLYCAIKNLIIANNYGYSAIYYGDMAYSTNSALVIISMMFFTAIMGIVIFSPQNAIIKKIAILSFALLSLIQFMSGDRSFVYQACILLSWHLKNKQKCISKKKVILLVILGYICIALLSAVKDVRNSTIAAPSLLAAIGHMENLPIANALLEMGSSMSPLVAIVAYGGNPYPYGNTFLFAIPGMITENLVSFIGIPYQSLANWFSFSFLGLTSGAAFSIIAEIYMNFGLSGGILFAVIMGAIICAILECDDNNPKGELFSYSALAAIILIARNTFQTGVKNLFWGVIAYCCLLYLINSIVKKRLLYTSNNKLGQRKK